MNLYRLIIKGMNVSSMLAVEQLPQNYTLIIIKRD